MSANLLARAHAAFTAGRFEAALRDADAVLAGKPAQEQALSIKANAAMRLDDADALLDALQRLHALRPDDATIRRNLATVLNRRGNRAFELFRYADAERQWRSALRIEPGHREARFNLAGLLRRSQQWAEALDLYESLEREGHDPEVVLRIADCLCEEGRPEDAAHLVRAHAFPPTLLNALAEVANRCGAVEVVAAHLARAESHEARVDAVVAAQLDAVARRNDSDALIAACFEAERIGERSPELQVVLTPALSLPHTLRDRDDVDHVRARFARELDRLAETFDEDRLRRCQPRLAQVAWSNFLLAYQNRDDLELQTRFGDWLHRAATVLGRELPPLPDRRRPGRPRIGLVSANWHLCTVGSYFGRWIEALSAVDAELHVVHLGPREDAGTEDFAARAPHFHRFGPDVDRFVAQTRALDLDLAIFPELGMIQRLFAAAAAGVARAQWMAWGHPVTSGLPTVSHYLSCAEMEPEHAQRVYRESLRLLPGIGTRYALPAKPALRDRAALGLPEGPLAIVPQSIFKVLPSNDPIYAHLLDARGDLRIAFFGADPTVDASQFRARLRGAVGPRAAERLLFLPELSRGAFLETLAACDLMIDTLGWSGGNSALDALRAELPIVTCPGEFMRGRQCATMLRLLGIEGGQAATPETLARLALERIDDRGFRTHFSDRVRLGLSDLVDDPAVDRALTAHVGEALES